MSSLPFLLFPKAVPDTKARRGGGGAAIHLPSAARQKQRLDDKFRAIAAGLAGLQPSADGCEPEQVIVFETLGDDVSEFAAAAAKVPGLEWVAELDLGDREPDDDFYDPADQAEPLPARLYAVMSNAKALQHLLALWDDWQADETKRARAGFGPFKDVFVHLHDLRRWSSQDRLHGTGVLEAWDRELTLGREAVRFEVELWCRADPATRARAYDRLDRLVTAEGGRCVAQAAVPDILYHGVLVELPSAALRRTVDRVRAEDYSELVRCGEVMLFRPRGQAVLPVGEPATEPQPSPPPPPAGGGDPVVAVLDGLPLANHQRLAGRVRIDDPDGLSARYQPAQQSHGTAMCSLILHGDLSRPEPPLDRPVYVRPVLAPVTDLDGHSHEASPDDVLLVDLFHRAVRRIVAGDAGEPPAAPGVKVVNLSFGNTYQPFDRQFSPLARLLDWLAWKYKLLFLVSAGNQLQPLTITSPAAGWRTLPADDLRTQAIHALWQDQAGRRPYSPAESINALTVGAWHEDGSPVPTDQRVDLFGGASLPSPLGTVAAGYRQAVKPEVYFAGGRQLYFGPVGVNDQPAEFRLATTNRPPGLLVAAPGVSPMELDRAAHTRGTSNATALATRCAALAHQKLAEYRQQPGWERLTDDYLPVLLKALVVHGANWRDGREAIETALRAAGMTDGRAVQRALNRFIGCGRVDPGLAQGAAEHRGTVLGWDSIRDEEGHVYTLPLPGCLNSVKEWRRLTLTLAWLTPVNFRHRAYRKSFLWMSLGADEKTKLKVEKAGLDVKASERGTVQHWVLEGDKASVFEPDKPMQVKVSCRADAGKLAEPIPYALAVSIEVAEGVNLPIYQELKAVLVPIQPKP